MFGNFFFEYMVPFFLLLAKTLIIIIPLLLSVAYLTYAERKIIARMQLRKGPNVVGLFGLLQPLADGLKLMFKEIIIPNSANKVLFVIAPMITFVVALAGWVVIPFSENGALANINVGVLYILAMSSLGVYGIIIAGWASNSNYAFLGAMRSTAQMLSYEVSIGLVIITVLLTAGSLNLSEIIYAHAAKPLWLKILLFPMAIVFFISILAETNRHPFDLPEAEAELVAGYNVEYSSMLFAMFFLGEYANMILTSAMLVILFWGGWLPMIDLSILSFVPGFAWFILKILVVLFCFIWVRASFPRYRYDQLMRLGWKVFLPLSLFYVVFISAILLICDMLPRI